MSFHTLFKFPSSMIFGHAVMGEDGEELFSALARCK